MSATDDKEGIVQKKLEVKEDKKQNWLRMSMLPPTPPELPPVSVDASGKSSHDEGQSPKSEVSQSSHPSNKPNKKVLVDESRTPKSNEKTKSPEMKDSKKSAKKPQTPKSNEKAKKPEMKDSEPPTKTKDAEEPPFAAFCIPMDPNAATTSPVIDEAYSRVHQQITHPALKQFDAPGHQWTFPTFVPKNKKSMREWVRRSDHRRLMRDPKEYIHRKLTGKLYVSYGVIDLAMKWVFRGGVCLDVLVTPAHMFERAYSIKLKQNTMLMIEEVLREDVSDSLCKEAPHGFFMKKLIDIMVWHAKHFSRVFIVNANKVLTREYCHPDKKRSDPAPCIIFCNSMNGSGLHTPDKVAGVMRWLLNAADRMINGSVGARFSVTTLPVIGLDGSE